MMGRLQVICTMDQTKEAKRNVQRYMRKHKSDEDFIKNYICLFNYLFISSQMSAKPYFIGSTGILPLW